MEETIMTDDERAKIVSLNRFKTGPFVELDRVPVVPCPAQGLDYDVCDEPNCSRDCMSYRALKVA
jgi:hypothetical protein